MYQHVQNAIHTAGGWLDLVITQSEVKVMGPLVSNIDFSDHWLVNCQLLVNLSDAVPIPVEVRKLKGFSVESFKSDLWRLELDSSSFCWRIIWQILVWDVNFALPPCTSSKEAPAQPMYDDECTDFKLSTCELKKKYQGTWHDDNRKEWITSLKSRWSIFARKRRFTGLLVQQLWRLKPWRCGTVFQLNYVVIRQWQFLAPDLRLVYLGQHITWLHRPLTDLDFIT